MKPKESKPTERVNEWELYWISFSQVGGTNLPRALGLDVDADLYEIIWFISLGRDCPDQVIQHTVWYLGLASDFATKFRSFIGPPLDSGCSLKKYSGLGNIGH
jgi:hypothetical protein